MRIATLHHQVKRLLRTFLLSCLLIQNLYLIEIAHAIPGDCSKKYDNVNDSGWVIELCATETNPKFAANPMQVLMDGVSQGNGVVVLIYHKSQDGLRFPQVAVIYSSGYVRLKQNVDPAPAIPFGTSFILGPGYWAGPTTYYHNPQLTQLEINTTQFPNSPLRMKAEGTNHDFAVTYEMTLPPPRDRQTRLHVTQTYTATANINIDSNHRNQREGFKLVQASSMFINATNCVSGYIDCHDSNAARYIANDLIRVQTTFTGPTAYLFNSSPQPKPLGSTWIDVLHTDDTGWQGNTSNTRIALDYLPSDRTITPQGNIDINGIQNDPNAGDNVNLWLHDDGSAAASWQSGERAQVSYWLLAQDNPPEPWADLGLRTGSTFLNFEGSYSCSSDSTPSTMATKSPIEGFTDTALQLTYDLGNVNDRWAQVRCNFDPPLDLSAYDHLRFDWRGNGNGNPITANSLQIGLIDSTGRIFGTTYRHAVHRAWWGQMVVPFRLLQPWTTGIFDPAHVSAFFISVKKIPKDNINDVDDEGGAGSIAIDNLSAYNVVSRTTSNPFETVHSDRFAAQTAAKWLASQQQTNITGHGLLRSWVEDPVCLAHTYDQALGLLVFSNQGMWKEADALTDRLVATQNTDGSWYQTRTCTGGVDNSSKWEGDIAWTIYSLSRYLASGGTHTQSALAIQKGSDWLATRVGADGCLLKDTTEGTIDAWWAFRAAGASHAGDAEKIKSCLLNYYWDNSMGRFKGGRDSWQPYLDNQTWGAAFLKAIGEPEKARRALSYAQDVLRVPSQGGELLGLDGNAGPWSVWNEGTAQYIAAGGEGARDLLIELLAQQGKDGSMIGSPDDFNGGGVWTTRWHGVAPTAWLYNALCGEPFHPGSQSLCSSTTGSVGDTTGVFRPSNGLLYLKNKNETGFADMALNYGLGGDYPVVGDWDGDGNTTIGVYRNGTFYLRNSNTIGFAEIVFPFGSPGDQPIAGDWDGDGIDTVGVYRSSTGQFLLRNSNNEGVAQMSFYLGNVGDVGIAGDWDGDGIDTTGVFRPSNGLIFLKNTNETGFADIALNYGLPGDQPVTGDWDNDGIDTIGVYRNGSFYLRNSNTIGFAEIIFGLGNPGDMPIAGNWDGLP